MYFLSSLQKRQGENDQICLSCKVMLCKVLINRPQKEVFDTPGLFGAAFLFVTNGHSCIRCMNSVFFFSFV